MCGLAPVSTGLDIVIRTDGNIDFLLVIAVEITEHEVVASVGILFPSFECRRDVLSAGVLDLRTHSDRSDTEQGKSHKKAQKIQKFLCFFVAISYSHPSFPRSVSVVWPFVLRVAVCTPHRTDSNN